MASLPSSEPDRPGLVLYVGQDGAGHWLVQDSAKRLEGRFASSMPIAAQVACSCTPCAMRALGLTAIEGRGMDRSPALIGRARAAAGRLVDPAVRVVFESKDMVTALHDERDFPADVILWRVRQVPRSPRSSMPSDGRESL